MNNKGFTLIEIIAVIVIIGLMGTVVTIGLNATLKKSQENNCNDFIDEIETAACTYAGINCTRDRCSAVNVGTLIEEGLLKSEIDACTGNAIDKNKTVSITWSTEGEKTCSYEG